MSMTLRARTSDRAARTASARNPLNGLFAASVGASTVCATSDRWCSR